MDAIILAAGIGKRLGSHAENKSKCLLTFDGISLLQRHLSILIHYNISRIIVVTGYQSDQVRIEIENSEAAKITTTIDNPDFDQGSLISMLIGLEKLTSNENFLLMDADVLYDHNLIYRLINSEINDCFMLDKDFVAGDEPVKICIRDGKIVEFRKIINKNLTFDFQGESVGFFRFTFETALELKRHAWTYLENNKNDTPYEEVIRDLLLENPDKFGFEDITGLKWIEIDFPEDIERANTEILSAISQVYM